MSASDRGRDETPGAQRDAAAPSDSPPTGAEAYASWLDRMQRARARQAAITRNLYTWSNYKNWADQIRDSWAANDGSGGNAASRLPSTLRVLERIAATRGPLLGRYPDQEVYRLLLDQRLDVFVGLGRELAQALSEPLLAEHLLAARRLGDPVRVEREQIAGVAVEPLCPQMRVGSGIDQLRANAHPTACTLHCAF